jgi:hypothetical protein
MYFITSSLDCVVMDLIGTSAAAVPAAMTSAKEESSSYLICEPVHG